MIYLNVTAKTVNFFLLWKDSIRQKIHLHPVCVHKISHKKSIATHADTPRVHMFCIKNFVNKINKRQIYRLFSKSWNASPAPLHGYVPRTYTRTVGTDRASASTSTLRILNLQHRLKEQNTGAVGTHHFKRLQKVTGASQTA